MILVIIGALALIVTIISYFSLKGKEKQLLTLGAVEDTTVSELKRLSDEVGKDETLGKGYFNRDVKINGIIRTESPLKSEFAREECVWYSNEVVRVYEVEETEKDSEGNTKTVTKQKEERVSDRNKETEFYIDDGTGKIFVSTDGLNFDKEEAFDRYQPYEEVKDQGFKINIGGLTFNLKGMGSGKGSRTLGYRYKEWIIPVNKKVIILGEAKDADGYLRMYKPTEKHYDYMMKFGTETELKRSLDSSIDTLGKVIAISAILGLGLAVAGILLMLLNIM